MQNQLSVQVVFNAQVIAKNGSAESGPIDLTYAGSNKSLQIHQAGDGTGKYEYLLSNDGVNFIVPEGGGTIVDGVTKTGGPGTDGKLIKPFTTGVAQAMKIRVTEADVEAINVTAVLGVL